MRIIYECGICGKQYETDGAGMECENMPIPTPKYEIGDTVYVHQQYPEDKNRPYKKVEVVDVDIIDHDVRYELSEMVEVGDGYYVGYKLYRGWGVEDESYAPAYESSLCQIGDKRWDDTVLTLDMVGK